MLKFDTIIHNQSQFPDNYEIIVQQRGRQSEFIRKLTAFTTALEFIKKEYEGNVNNCYDNDQIKYSTLIKFLDYIDKPYTPKEKTYEIHMMNKLGEQLFLEQDDMDMIPLQLTPLYVIDRQHSKDSLIIEKENELLINDNMKNIYKQMQEDNKVNEQHLKEEMIKQGKKYTPPCENFYREKAIMALYYYTLQQQTSSKLQIGDNSSLGIMSKNYDYNPRESAKFDASNKSILHLFTLLPDEQRQQLAQQLNLYEEKDGYNFEKIKEKLEEMKEGEQQELANQLVSLV